MVKNFFSQLQKLNNDQKYRQKIIPIIFEDLNGNNKDMQIEAIKIIPHIPPSLFLVAYLFYKN